MAQRYDIGTLGPPQKRADGTIVFDAHLTRSGVFTYRNPDGTTRREYRPDSEVHKAESMASFALVPVTNDHPKEMLTAKNARQFAVGAVGENVRQDGDHVAAKVAVFDESTLTAMAAGKRDVSCGYECDLVEAPGVAPGGERYDAMQTNIVGNHLAIVSAGRAGTSRVRMDGAWMEPVTLERDSRSDSKEVMDLTQALAALAAANEKIGALTSRADTAERTAADVKKSLDVAEAKSAELQIKFDTAEKARKDAIEAGPAKVRARVELETKAAPILGKEIKLDGLDDRAIQVAVIKKISNVDVPTDKSIDYVSARFDAALERAGQSADAFRAANDIIVANATQRDDSAVDAGEVAKLANVKAAQNLYIQPKA